MKKLFKKYYLYLIGIVGCAIALFVISIYEQPSELAGFNPVPMTEEKEITYIYVDLKGEVKNPGVYKVVTGSRLFQVVSLAGGITSEADELAINLAIKLSDQQVVYIPNINEDFPLITIPTNGQTSQLVNINTASIDLLDTLPGIGPTTAQSIITYRSEHGDFLSIEALLDVPGIGEGTLSEIRSLITV